MLYTAQCQNPLPAGASGSNTWSVNDFVPDGGLDQTSAGEMLPPVQPKPLRMYWVANVPEERSGLEIVKTGVCAIASLVSLQPLMPTHPATAVERAISVT